MDSGGRIVSAAWMPLHDELARWRDAGRVADFWWRDDDAGQPAPALARLTRLAHEAQIPLALAVIPLDASPDLVQAPGPWVSILQHGCDHRSRAAAGEKKTEFPAAEAVPDALARLALGMARIAGPQTVRALVPPWNRVSSPALLAQLAQAGYQGLSRFGPRGKAPAVPGLVQVNTHVDIIDWQGTRGFVGLEAALATTVAHLRARRIGEVDGAEPTGVLSHHAVHDAACWDFLARLFETSTRDGAARWRTAAELFAPGQ
jgi:hypothetical protein